MCVCVQGSVQKFSLLFVLPLQHTRPAHFTAWHLIKKHPSTRDAQYISVSVYRHPLSSSSSPSCIDGTNRYTVGPAAATRSLHLCSGVFQAVSVCPCARGLISNLPAPHEGCGCAGSPAARQKRRPCQPSAVTRLCLIDVRDALRRADGERHYAPLRQRISLRFAPSGWRVAALSLSLARTFSYLHNPSCDSNDFSTWLHGGFGWCAAWCAGNVHTAFFGPVSFGSVFDSVRCSSKRWHAPAEATKPPAIATITCLPVQPIGLGHTVGHQHQHHRVPAQRPALSRRLRGGDFSISFRTKHKPYVWLRFAFICVMLCPPCPAPCHHGICVNDFPPGNFPCLPRVRRTEQTSCTHTISTVCTRLSFSSTGFSLQY